MANHEQAGLRAHSIDPEVEVHTHLPKRLGHVETVARLNSVVALRQRAKRGACCLSTVAGAAKACGVDPTLFPFHSRSEHLCMG